MERHGSAEGSEHSSQQKPQVRGRDEWEARGRRGSVWGRLGEATEKSRNGGVKSEQGRLLELLYGPQSCQQITSPPAVSGWPTLHHLAAVSSLDLQSQHHLGAW